MRLAAAICAMFIFSAATAGTLRLDGPLTPGGLLRGSAGPGAVVTLDGRKLPVSPEGYFLVGFGRDAAPHAALEVRFGDGAVERRPLHLAKRAYTVQRIDGLPSRQVSPDAAALKRITAEAAQIKAARRRVTARTYYRSGFVWPLTGIVTGVYGSQRILNGKPRSPHLGVDVTRPEGTVIVALADGVVSLAAEDMFFTGKTLMLDHGQGLTSVYAHMSALLVKAGEVVRRGAPIGKVGATGRVTGPHLHYGVHLRGTGLDPMLLTGPMPKQ